MATIVPRVTRGITERATQTVAQAAPNLAVAQPAVVIGKRSRKAN